jgi:mono/diheme cytochrome c family protein
MRKMVLWAMAGLFLGVVLMGIPAGAGAADGKAVFMDKCVPCHGEKGDGKGAMASNFSHHPGNFNDPKFWQGDVNKKISDAITKGKDEMIPVDLKPDEIKAVTEYINKAFKK